MKHPVRWRPSLKLGSLTAGFAIAVVVVAGFAKPPSAGALVTTDYRGSVIGDQSATVSFRVRASNQGERRTVAFTYANVLIFYEDGSTARTGRNTVIAPFKRQRTFHTELPASDQLGSSYAEFHGRLLRGGRARGYLVLVNDYFDPPPPDWSTHGRVLWKAERKN